MTRQKIFFEVSTRSLSVSWGRKVFVTSIKMPTGGTLRIARTRPAGLDASLNGKLLPSRKPCFASSRPTTKETP